MRVLLVIQCSTLILRSSDARVRQGVSKDGRHSDGAWPRRKSRSTFPGHAQAPGRQPAGGTGRGKAGGSQRRGILVALAKIGPEVALEIRLVAGELDDARRVALDVDLGVVGVARQDGPAVDVAARLLRSVPGMLD